MDDFKEYITNYVSVMLGEKITLDNETEKQGGRSNSIVSYKDITLANSRPKVLILNGETIKVDGLVPSDILCDILLPKLEDITGKIGKELLAESEYTKSIKYSLGKYSVEKDIVLFHLVNRCVKQIFENYNILAFWRF